MALILVIDDDPQIRSMLKRLLLANEHSVIDAEGGREGLAAFYLHQPDIVVTDLIMPDVEGIETITEIRRHTPRTKIIAISGGGRNKDPRFLNSAEKLGADIVIAKPFRMAEMIETINRLLPEGLRQAG